MTARTSRAHEPGLQYAARSPDLWFTRKFTRCSWLQGLQSGVVANRQITRI